MKKHFLLLITLFSFTLFITSCGDSDVPGEENEEEVIDRVMLVFVPDEGETVSATAFDEDGEGPNDFEIDEIVLAPNTTYTLSIEVDNTIESEDITSEIEEEAEEHMFFFAFTNNIFTNPAGDGNIDNRSDAMNYLDEDANELPLGLETSWTTGSATTGTFRTVLKHQPNAKSASSTASTGETDIDITWTLTISNPN